MGYRSDVAFAFYSVDEEHNGIVNIWLKENLPFKDWVDACFTPMENGYKFYIDNIKWYEDTPDVQRILKVADQFKDLFIYGDNQVAALEYVRIGENYDDNEEEYYGNVECILSISRSINGV